jgi:hypothetical protein
VLNLEKFAAAFSFCAGSENVSSLKRNNFNKLTASRRDWRHAGAPRATFVRAARTDRGVFWGQVSRRGMLSMIAGLITSVPIGVFAS